LSISSGVLGGWRVSKGADISEREEEREREREREREERSHEKRKKEKKEETMKQFRAKKN